jgi:acyl-CoA thioesterase I
MLKRFLWVLLLWVPIRGISSALAAEPVILVLGDSLSAAYGIAEEAGWVRLLQGRLENRGYRYRVANASITGDTTRSGVTRLPEALARNRPAIVLVELGGNDGLRGLPVSEVRRNLAAIIEHSLAYGAKVLLLGIRVPPNYGPAYAKRFQEVYAGIAETYRVPWVPFLLAGVAGQPQLMQADGIHPRAEAQGKILENVWGRLEPMLGPEH